MENDWLKEISPHIKGIQVGFGLTTETQKNVTAVFHTKLQSHRAHVLRAWEPQ